NAVGACAADARELPSDLVKRSRFYCDSVESVMHESGDFLFPLKEGLITEEHLLGTVGELLCGKKEGRTSEEQITVFESLGMAAEDLAAADYVLGKE
ncbi:MAG: ornithine cyclodeaminase family protein, partial [Erysipelotrichaceae bacterium]|nr:ornithine cyclodeaminase family protein [Erysipelotrichaceae bacterium]